MTSLAQLERGVVGYWCPMLATTGLRLYDRSGRGNHGTMTNMDAATDWVTASVRGRNGRVLDLDGLNDYVDLSNQAGVFPTISVAVWVKHTQSAVARIVTKPRVASSQQAYSLAINIFSAGQANWIVNTPTYTGLSSILSSTTSINDGKWHFLVGTFGDSFSRLYVDGSREASSSATGDISYDNLLPLQIGRFDALGQYFSGQIAEASIWNRALTATEIRTLYRIGPGWLGRRETRRRYAVAQAAGFKAYWARRQSQVIGGGF